MKKLKKRSFTIVELVIVIAVIAILAAVLIPTFSGIINKANQSAALQTARNALTGAASITSNASLPGKDDAGNYRTVFIVGDYAFGYDGGELFAIDYPTQESLLEAGANFNAVILSSENVGDDFLDENVAAIISKTTDFSEELGISVFNGYTLITDGAKACSCFSNSDISPKAIILTTFSNAVSNEELSEIIANSGLEGYTLSATGKGNTVNFGNLH